MVRLDPRDGRLPERERLRVRIVDPEDMNALRDPVPEDALEVGPQRGPVLGFEVEGVDVLVLLRRVLRVLESTVGALPEPRRVVLDPRMIGRSLERDVEGDRDALFRGGVDEGAEVPERAELVVEGG